MLAQLLGLRAVAMTLMAKLELQSLQTNLDSGVITETLTRVCTLIDDTIHKDRTLTSDLSNPAPYEVGFDAAVESWLARQAKEVSGIDYHFSQFGPELTSTFRGTERSSAWFMASTIQRRWVSTSAVGSSNTSSSWTCRIKRTGKRSDSMRC